LVSIRGIINRAGRSPRQNFDTEKAECQVFYENKSVYFQDFCKSRLTGVGTVLACKNK